MDGFIPFYSLEDMSWLGASELDFFMFPMVCFCDIPIGRITEHVDFYGSYGLGMSRDWVIRNGINPIAYYSKASPLSSRFLDALLGASDIKEQNQEHTMQNCLFTMLAYAKPVFGTIFVKGSPQQKDFYLESEWRYVPDRTKVPHPLTKEHMDDKVKRHDKKIRAAVLKFTPNEVRYIFVKQDSDIPPLINYMNDKLQHHSAVDLKILMSRVISLEHLEKDV